MHEVVVSAVMAAVAAATITFNSTSQKREFSLPPSEASYIPFSYSFFLFGKKLSLIIQKFCCAQIHHLKNNFWLISHNFFQLLLNDHLASIHDIQSLRGLLYLAALQVVVVVICHLSFII